MDPDRSVRLRSKDACESNPMKGRNIPIADIRANYSEWLFSLESRHNVYFAWSEYSHNLKHYLRLLLSDFKTLIYCLLGRHKRALDEWFKIAKGI